MKLYALIENVYNSNNEHGINEVIGIFSSLELAKAATPAKDPWSGVSHYFIDEFTLDKLVD